MGITYDAGTNTITVTGFSESSPCTFEDIYQADVDNGWGVVHKQNEYQYQIDAKLRIGDGSTETWFKDIKRHVVITPATGDAFFVANNATFQLGEIDEHNNPLNGCCLVIPNYEGDTPFYGYDNGAWRLYDSEIYYPAFLYLWSRGAVPPTHEIIGCRFIKFMGMRIAGENSVVKDCVFHAESETWSMIGLTFKGQLAEVSNIHSYKMMYGVYWSPQYGLSDATITGLKIRNCQYAIRVYGEYGDYSLYLIDADIDNWTIKWENMSTDANKIYRQYTFKVRAVDKDGNPISGAVVEVWDKFNNKVVTAMTDSNGDIVPQIVTYGHYAYPTGNTINPHGPHTVRITKHGYRTVEFVLNIDRRMDLVIPLNAEDYTLDEIYEELKKHDRKMTGFKFI